jgi:RNA recognition motif-containing protein
MQGCGKVLEVRMPRYHDSGRPRGYAHLDFKKAVGLEKAMGLNGKEHPLGHRDGHPLSLPMFGLAFFKV